MREDRERLRRRQPAGATRRARPLSRERSTHENPDDRGPDDPAGAERGEGGGGTSRARFGELEGVGDAGGGRGGGERGRRGGDRDPQGGGERGRRGGGHDPGPERDRCD